MADFDTQTQSEGMNGNMILDTDSQAAPILRAWGKLYKKSLKFKNLGIKRFNYNPKKQANRVTELYHEDFSAGRNVECNLVFQQEDVPDIVFVRISKIQFTIKRDLSKVHSPTYITDHSRNGTFLNGKLIGTNNTKILANDDVIAVIQPTFKLYQFSYSGEDNFSYQFPDQIRKTYHISRELGSGACGVVRLVYDRNSCTGYAMKTVKRNLMASHAETRMRARATNNDVNINREITIMQTTDHPCIINTHEIIERPDAVYMVIELMEGGDLLSRIVKDKFLSEQMSKLFFYQMCRGVQYLHSKGITHRDIKPDNILLATTEVDTLLKLSDFGLSKIVRNDSELTTVCGTPNYVAPEVIKTQGRGKYTQKVDVWSLGVVLFTCLSGTLPFHDTPKTKSSEQILKGKFSYSHPVWRSVSTQAKTLINEMLTVDPNQRPSINEVFQHSWLRDTNVWNKAKRLMATKQTDANLMNKIEEPFSHVRLTEVTTTETRQSTTVNNKTFHDINANIDTTDFTFTPPPKRQRVE